MNCPQARERFAESLYGELDALDQSELAAHLSACDACRAELADLAAAQRSLNLAGVSDEAKVEPAARRAFAAALVYRTLADRAERRGRRWRRVALWTGCAAALVLFLALADLRLEVDSSRVIISWRDAPVSEQAETPVAQPAAFADPWPDLQRQQDRLDDASELFQLVVAELDAMERRQTKALAEAGREQRAALKELARRVDLLRGGHQLSSLHLAALQGDMHKLGQYLTALAPHQ